MVSFEWYRSFIEVYRVGTVSKAAEVLHLTQPAVSQHLAALEAAIADRLFERTPRRMIPTEAGHRLYSQIVGAIETLESVDTKQQRSHSDYLIRLGTPQEFFTEQILNRLPREIRFTIRLGITETLIEQLLDHQLDCVIATQKLTRSDLEYQPIYEESFWLVAPPEISLPFSSDLLQADLTPLVDWLRTQDWITYSEEFPIIRRFWRVVFGRRLEAQAKLMIPDLRAIRQAVSAGFGLSVLPDYLCETWVNENRLTLILQPTKAVTNQIWLAYRKRDRQTQPIQILLKLIGDEAISSRV